MPKAWIDLAEVQLDDYSKDRKGWSPRQARWSPRPCSPAPQKRGQAALVVLGLFITAGSCIYGLYPWTAPTQRLSEDVPLAVVVDAGSTGTRVHIYCFSQGDLCKELGLPRSSSNQPALSTCEDLPCLSQLLEPLLNRAADAVPARFRPRTPLAIRATAGFRLLSHPKAELLLKLMRSITKQYGFKDAGVEVMSGDDEGLLQWLAVNRLLGTLRGPAPVAVLDLGGASTQIAYLVDDEPSLLHPSRRAFLRQLPFPGGRTVRLYEHSYLGYGLVAARQRIMQAVNASKLDSNPCLPRNAQPGAGATEGQGDAARCSEVIGRMLRPPDCVQGTDGAVLEHCEFAQIWTGPGWNASNRTRAAGCSFFFYGLEDAAALPAEATSAEVTPQRYLDLAQHACSMEADQLPASYPGRRRGSCDLCYTFTLLTVGFGLQANTAMLAVKSLPSSWGNSSASWSLGLALQLADLVRL
ncbi:unnamed protein product [Durusdinium trenchii]|uniref:Uncharacterized protein n=1 Tax=Durusdinium trenchii TaxID=1381693 RepID=A0ABP0PLG0_9DINO